MGANPSRAGGGKREKPGSDVPLETNRSNAGQVVKDTPADRARAAANAAHNETNARDPVACLPFELLATILDLVLAQDDVNQRGRCAAPVLRYATVSRAWLEVAKSPYFWREIDLSWRPVVTDNMLRYLVEHISATSLSLRGCQYLTDQALQYLAKCHKLTQLNMGGCRKLTDEAFRLLFSGDIVLQELSLDWCTKITDETVELVASKCATSLTKLTLRGCTLTNRSVYALASCTSLVDLDISECHGTVNEEGALALALGVPGLQRLSLASNRWRVEPVAILANALQAQCWTGLVALDLAHALYTGQQDIDLVLARLPLLQELSLRGWSDSSPLMVDIIAARLPNLRRLDLAHCSRIAPHGVRLEAWSGLLAGCPHLEELNLACLSAFHHGEGPQVVRMLIEHPPMKKLVLSGVSYQFNQEWRELAHDNHVLVEF